MTVAIDAEPANRSVRTGTENTAFNLIKQLMRLDGGNPDRQFILYTKDRLRADWPQLPPNFRHKKLAWPLPWLWSHLRLGASLLADRPDVIFIPAHSVPLLASGRILTAVHDIGFIERPDLYPALARLYHNFSLRLSIKKSSLIIVPTHAVRQSLASNVPSVKNIVVVPWGVDLFQYSPQAKPGDAELLKKFGLREKKYFLYVGRLEKKKNSERLIRAFAEFRRLHPELELALAGSNKEGLNPDVAKFINYQPPDVIAVLYRHALALVFPTNYEGFGLPVLEAQASGCPVAASDLPVLKEVSGGAAVFFNPESESELVAALGKLASGSQERDRLISLGAQNCQKFSWQNSAKKILDLIVKV